MFACKFIFSQSHCSDTNYGIPFQGIQSEIYTLCASIFVRFLYFNLENDLFHQIHLANQKIEK